MEHYNAISNIFGYAILTAVLCIPLSIALMAVRLVKRAGRGLIPNLIDKK